MKLKKAKKIASNYRGRVKVVKLKNPITLNSNLITRAIIELDHINYGLNKQIGGLNKKKRTNFSVADIEKFLSLLDGTITLFPEW